MHFYPPAPLAPSFHCMQGIPLCTHTPFPGSAKLSCVFCHVEGMSRKVTGLHSTVLPCAASHLDKGTLVHNSDDDKDELQSNACQVKIHGFNRPTHTQLKECYEKIFGSVPKIKDIASAPPPKLQTLRERLSAGAKYEAVARSILAADQKSGNLDKRRSKELPQRLPAKQSVKHGELLVTGISPLHRVSRGTFKGVRDHISDAMHIILNNCRDLFQLLCDTKHSGQGDKTAAGRTAGQSCTYSALMQLSLSLSL